MLQSLTNESVHLLKYYVLTLCYVLIRWTDQSIKDLGILLYIISLIIFNQYLAF